MPIKIYPVDNRKVEIAWLCGDSWRLPDQVDELKFWLENTVNTLPPGEYVADIGFCIRRDARGGGAALNPEFLSLLGKHNIYLFLSEYPGKA